MIEYLVELFSVLSEQDQQRILREIELKLTYKEVAKVREEVMERMMERMVQQQVVENASK